MNSEEKIAFSSKVKSALASAESHHPKSPAIKILHDQFNTIALDQEDTDDVPRGTYGGVDGTVTPNTGGTGKGGSK